MALPHLCWKSQDLLTVFRVHNSTWHILHYLCHGIHTKKCGRTRMQRVYDFIFKKKRSYNTYHTYLNMQSPICIHMCFARYLLLHAKEGHLSRNHPTHLFTLWPNCGEICSYVVSLTHILTATFIKSWNIFIFQKCSL